MASARRWRPERRSGPWRGSWIGPLLLVPLLAGCSGTPFGEALSRSFPAPAGPASEAMAPAAPPPAAAPPSPAATTSTGATAATPASGSTPRPPGSSGSGSPPGGSTATATASATKPGSTANAPLPAAPAAPPGGTTGLGDTAGRRQGAPQAPAPGSNAAAPYRVTIRLPRADPSAPAEVVTEALRSAGVPFEVETIERVGVVTPAAPAPASTTAPQVRPAPPPR
jgi:hypothetical protein